MSCQDNVTAADQELHTPNLVDTKTGTLTCRLAFVYVEVVTVTSFIPERDVEVFPDPRAC